ERGRGEPHGQRDGLEIRPTTPPAAEGAAHPLPRRYHDECPGHEKRPKRCSTSPPPGSCCCCWPCRRWPGSPCAAANPLCPTLPSALPPARPPAAPPPPARAAWPCA